jgi:hypothetical protein
VRSRPQKRQKKTLKKKGKLFFFSTIKIYKTQIIRDPKAQTMKKRKGIFSLDDFDEQLSKRQRENIGDGLPQHQQSEIIAEVMPELVQEDKTQPKRKTKAKAKIKRSKQHRFSVLTNAEIEDPEQTVIANPMSTMYEFNTLHETGNKKSTKELADQFKSERETLLLNEIANLKSNEAEKPAVKRESGGQKYKKKMDPEQGRFSRHDTPENDDRVKQFFKTEEEREQEQIKMDLAAFSKYEEDNILFRYLEEQERRRDETYRTDARENSSSMNRKLSEQESMSGSSYFDQPNSKILLEEVDVKYCAQFLREAVFKFERNCKQEDNCVAKKMYIQHPDSIEDSATARDVICREFLLPSQKEKFDKTGALPIYRQACLLCKRLLTTYTYKKNEKENREPLEIIQDHFNVVGAENGGYPLDSCLHPVANKNQKSGSKITGIVRPIRRFSAVDYVPSIDKITDMEHPGEFIEVRCFVETPLNFPIAPVVDIAITRQNPFTVTTEDSHLA